VELRINIDGDEKVIKLTKEMAARAQDMRPVMDAIGLHMIRSLQKNIKGGGRPNKWPANIFGTRLLSRGGGLFKSFSHIYDKQYVEVGTNLPYAAIQHFGGVIRPKRVKALPVPITKQAAKAQENVQSVREIEDLIFVPRKGLPPLLVKVKYGGRGKGRYEKAWEPWFVLKKSVKIPPRPYMLFQESDIRYIMRTIRGFLATGDVK